MMFTFCDTTVFLYPFIQFISFVHLLLHKYNICGIRKGIKIICHITGTVAKTTVLNYDQPVCSHKWKDHCHIRNLGRNDSAPLKNRAVHFISRCTQCRDQSIFVISYHISFFTIYEMKSFYLFCLDLFGNRWHGMVAPFFFVHYSKYTRISVLFPLLFMVIAPHSSVRFIIVPYFSRRFNVSAWGWW